MICGHGHKQKFRYPYPRDSKKIQMPYPRAKAIDQNPTLWLASPPPHQLDIDRCISPLLRNQVRKTWLNRVTRLTHSVTGLSTQVAPQCPPLHPFPLHFKGDAKGVMFTFE